MKTFLKHQAGSIVSTGVDFGTMIFFVRVVGLTPTFATALGAACGGAVNFTLGRRWIFRASEGAAHGQALRYAVVSGMSLVLNSFGEHLLAEVLHVQYVVARMLVAALVSVLWNFPMQRAFVFRARATP